MRGADNALHRIRNMQATPASPASSFEEQPVRAFLWWTCRPLQHSSGSRTGATTGAQVLTCVLEQGWRGARRPLLAGCGRASHGRSRDKQASTSFRSQAHSEQTAPRCPSAADETEPLQAVGSKESRAAAQCPSCARVVQRSRACPAASAFRARLCSVAPGVKPHAELSFPRRGARGRPSAPTARLAGGMARFTSRRGALSPAAWHSFPPLLSYLCLGGLVDARRRRGSSRCCWVKRLGAENEPLHAVRPAHLRSSWVPRLASWLACPTPAPPIPRAPSADLRVAPAPAK